MKKLRLVLFEECDRTCEGCCNKDWDIKNLPVVEESFKDFDKIFLTGGEPLLDTELLVSTIKKIKEETTAPIYLYTAKVDSPFILSNLLHSYIEGITLTLHEPEDRELFVILNSIFRCNFEKGRFSLRLNVFKGVDISGIDTSIWKVKQDIEWIEDCPLPEDEVLMRL